jgi:DNA-binding XRE family transcriptional regulator
MEQKRLFISGKKLSEARRSIRPKLSQETLADKIGISRQAMNAWEKREEIEINQEQGAKIAKALKIDINSLTLTNDMTSKEPVVKERASLYLHENTADLYEKFYKQHTTDDYVLMPRIIVETYEMIPKEQQEATRKMVADAMEQQRDFISVLKKNLEDLRKAQELGRSLKANKMQ